MIYESKHKISELVEKQEEDTSMVSNLLELENGDNFLGNKISNLNPKRAGEVSLCCFKDTVPAIVIGPDCNFIIFDI